MTLLNSIELNQATEPQQPLGRVTHSQARSLKRSGARGLVTARTMRTSIGRATLRHRGSYDLSETFGSSSPENGSKHPGRDAKGRFAPKYSGNLKGRPSNQVPASLSEILFEELMSPTPIEMNGKRTKVPLIQAYFRKFLRDSMNIPASQQFKIIMGLLDLVKSSKTSSGKADLDNVALDLLKELEQGLQKDDPQDGED